MDELLGLFLLGKILIGEELVEFLHILFAVEGNAAPLAAVASGAPRFLIIAFQRFGMS